MKKILTVALIILLSLAVLTACEGKNKDQEPTILPAQTITISDAAGLADMRNYTGIVYKNYTFELSSDIDLSGYDVWTPIGNNAENAFMGTFDGKGYTISNLTVKGWDDSGNPLYIGSDTGLEGVTSYSSMGLFGYTDSATLRDVKLIGMDMYYYVDIGHAYAAGLVGYNTGASLFENIEVAGDIKISNIYLKKKTFDNRGEYQNMRDECTTTFYAGGAVAFSNGASTFKNVTSSVNINNAYYHAYYQTKDTVEPEEAASTEVEEKYIVEPNSSYANIKLEQVFAGGVIGFLKNGKLENSSYDGNIRIKAKSIYASGLAAAAYNSSVINSTVENSVTETDAYIKNVLAGAVAQADNTKITNVTVNDVTVNAMKLGNVQNIGVGGIFGYAGNLAEVNNCTATDIKITAALIDAQVGGIGGAVRNAIVKDSVSTGAKLRMQESGINESDYKTFAVFVSAIYGNSSVKDCSGNAVNLIGVNEFVNNITCAVIVEDSYVDSDGNPTIRLFEKEKTGAYLSVYAEIDGSNLKIYIYDEELTLLKEAVYASNEGFVAQDNLAEKYLAVYFTDGTGFNTPVSGDATVEGRAMSNYEYRSGKPIISNLIISD